jgi:hypothetical protein
MNKTLIGSLAAIPLAAVGIFNFAGSAEAGVLQFSTNGTTWNTVAIDTDADGLTLFTGSYAGFLVNVTTGISKPLLGSAEAPHMDLNSVNVSGGGGSLYIAYTDTDFTGSVSELTSLVGGTTNGSVSFKTYIDNNNGLFGDAGYTGTLLSDLGSFGVGAFSNEGSTSASVTAPYSLTAFAVINHSSGYKVSSFDLEIKSKTSVPEPATLMGLGIVGAALVTSRRQKAVKS